MAPSPNSMSNDDVFQNSVYIGICIENVLYGIELLLYLKTIRMLLTNGGASKKSNVFYALFSSTMLFLVTVWVATQAMFGENMWIVDAPFAGGPDAYWDTHISVWYMDWGTTAIIMLQLMTDALMIYRCRIIWNNNLVAIMPIILWLSTLALGILVDWTSSLPGGDFFTGLASQFGSTYYTVSVVLHTTLTCMICYRITQHARAVKVHLGREYAMSYFAAVAMIVESVIPYTLSGIAFVVSIAIGSSTSVAFFCVYVLMMCISPQMLILRVIVGTAYDNDTFRPPASTVKFTAESTVESQVFDDDSATVRVETPSDAYRLDWKSEV